LTLRVDCVIAWREENAMLDRVDIPDTKPALELIDGQLVQKMSGKRRHQALEFRWTVALRNWAGDRGQAVMEWRHEFRAPGARFASLVPDVAYLSREALDELGEAAAEMPPCAPEIAVEILSAGENERRLAWKIAAYLAAGTRAVFVVDPPRRTVIVHAPDGVTRFGPGEVVAHPSVPDFAYPIDDMFAGLYLGE
jgi:Uma2 family endonuclease